MIKTEGKETSTTLATEKDVVIARSSTHPTSAETTEPNSDGKTPIFPVNDDESSESSIEYPNDEGKKRRCKKQLSSISTKRYVLDVLCL